MLTSCLQANFAVGGFLPVGVCVIQFESQSINGGGDTKYWIILIDNDCYLLKKNKNKDGLCQPQ